jgi:uncharacterized iron-regulated membrane protein
MTWFLTLSALGLWLFRRPILARLAPHLPDQRTRHRVLSTIIAAFVITAVLRLIVRYSGG